MPLPLRFAMSRSPKLSIRSHREVMRAVFTAAANQWHGTMLPEHFKPGADKKYNYAGRTHKWIKRKKVLAQRGKAIEGGLLPLVFTGLLRQSMLGHKSIAVFPSRVTVKMIGPRYISMRVYNSNQPDKAAEITTVTPGEKRSLAATMKRAYVEAMKTARPAGPPKQIA